MAIQTPNAAAAAAAKKARASMRAAKRTGTQAKRKASRSPGGYQSGRTVNPRAAGAAAMRRNAPRPTRRIRFEGDDWPLPRWGGGSAAGGTVENYNDQVKRKYGGGKL